MREWAAEVTVDEALARRLIGAQFPELELASVRLLGQGWDMTVWLVDEQWVFRFPRREAVIPRPPPRDLPTAAARLAATAADPGPGIPR